MKAFDMTGGDMKDTHETRIALLEQTCSNINETLKNIRMDIKELDVKIENKLDKISNRIWFNFYWGVAGIASVLGVLAHALKWIP
jgi:predicted component of viral defense system (DUF524 family)